ncbi:MAG: hypothetical protein JNL97_04695, partial [Verrucomicrobiales bacterium]|nr:hypothetical protein [Verrucomicrobiales bacterium]
MNLSDTDLAILGRLRRIFADYFGMIDCPNLAALRETPPASPNSGSRPLRRFVINTRQPRFRLRVCQALDTEADAFVVDAELGSLALVHLVRLPQVDDPARSAEARENLRAWISGRIHEAAYLRHLLVECLRPGEPQHGAAPYFVEVVFVEAGEGLSGLLGEILQKSARELAILHAIGIGVLPFHPELVAPGPVASDYRPSGALLPG